MKHFLKHNDETRLDPVRIIKSFAFQLALQLPAVAEYILGLDVKTVDQLRNMESAYHLLLAMENDDDGEVRIVKEDQQVIILIDALDEGDPHGDKSQGFEPVGNKVTHYVHVPACMAIA